MLSVALFGFRVLEPSRENQNDPYVVRWNRWLFDSIRIDRPTRCLCESIVLFGESASPFIDEGDGFIRESVRERACVCYLVLLPTSSGTRRVVGAHNIVDVWMHVVGSTPFFWYGQCRRLPYCRINVDATTLFMF